jgi:hypothetical protein
MGARKNEVEYYKSTYLDAKKVYESFRVPKDKQLFNKEFHPLKPFEKPFVHALSKVSLWVLIIALIIFSAISFKGKGVLTNQFKVTNLTSQHQETFVLDSTKFLNTIELNSSSPKALKNFNFKIYHNNHLSFSLNGTQAYRFKSDSNKIATIFPKIEKDAIKVLIYLKLDQLGKYKLEVTPIDKSIPSKVEVTIKKERRRGNYNSYFINLLLFNMVLYQFFKWKYKRKLNRERGLEEKELYSFNKYSFLYIILFILFFIISIFLLSS